MSQWHELKAKTETGLFDFYAYTHPYASVYPHTYMNTYVHTDMHVIQNWLKYVPLCTTKYVFFC